MSSRENIEGFAANTRTFMYKEVISSAVDNNYVIWGRTPARGNDFLVSFTHMKFVSIEHPMFEAEKANPEGNWAVMVVANMTEDSDVTKLYDYIRSSLLLGTFPSNVSKVAVFGSSLRKPWYEGLYILSENGVFLVSDYAEALVRFRHDPVGTHNGFVYSNRIEYEHAELPEEIVEMIDDELLYKVALSEAYSMLSSVKRGGYVLLPQYVQALSSSTLTWPAHKLFTENGSPIIDDIPDALRRISGAPPKDHSMRKITDTAAKTQLLHRAWNAYLRRYGVYLNIDTTVPDLDPFRSPEMDDFISRICSGENADSDSIEFEATLLGFLPQTPRPLDNKPFNARTWASDSQVRFKQPRPTAGNQPFSETIETAAIRQAIACLSHNLPVTSKYVNFSCIVVDGANTSKAMNPAQAAAMAKGPRWGVVTMRSSSTTQPTAAVCALMSGVVGFDDIDVIVSIVYDDIAISPECTREAIAILAEAGIKHLCDESGAFDDVADLRPYVHNTRNSRRLPSRLLVIPEKADPHALALFEKQAKAEISKIVREPLSAALRTLEPERAEDALFLMCGKKIELPRQWEENNNTEESLGLELLVPLTDFYPQYDTSVPELVDIAQTWNVVLEEHGLMLSPDFPVGVDPDLFAKTAEIIGISSYLEALDAGIPFEDLFPENNIRRWQ